MDHNWQKQQNPSMDDIKKIAQSEAGKNLYSALQQSHGEELEKAMKHASSGNISEAKNALSAILNTPEFQAFIRKMGGAQDG